jgi:uncharacterized protein YndB with AHSA1/START domain
MARYEQSVDIAAPPARVWEIMADVERWPEWTASVQRLERLEPGPLAVGASARIKQPGFMAARWRVTSIEPGREFVWETKPYPGATVAGRHRVEVQGEGGARVTLSITSSGPLAPLMAPLLGPVSRRNLRIEAEGLKKRAEAG